MFLDEYNSLMATNHELYSKKNEKHLDSAIEKLAQGESFSKELIDGWWNISLLTNLGTIIYIGKRRIKETETHQRIIEGYF